MYIDTITDDDVYEFNFDNIIKFRYYQNYKKSDEYKEILKQKRL